MKFFTATALLAAAVVSAVVCIPFMPAAKEHSDLFVLQVRATTGSPGRLQVYYDLGNGFDETLSSDETLIADRTPHDYRLPLPSGEIRQLRLDPTDGDAPVTIHVLRVSTRDGKVVRELPFGELVPAHDIKALQPQAAALEVVPTPKTNDPQLLITLQPPLVLAQPWSTRLTSGWQHAAGVFAALAILLFVLDRSATLRAFLSRRVQVLIARPMRATLLVAAIAAIASSYPVVFLGKSFVSPNNGPVLLYESYPTLPGYTDATSADVMGSDVGAIMWQHVPLSVVQANALRHGEVPLWNRYNTGGTPLLGQGQSMFGDPLHLLVIAANSAAWAWDLKYLIAKWLFAAALGLLVLEIVGREKGTPLVRLSALIVAAAAPFIGFFIYRVNHPAFFSLCYAPWALYCWVQVAQAQTFRRASIWAGTLIIANLALMNSGTAKEAYMLLLTMNFAGACVLIAQASAWRIRLGKLLLLSWAGILFALITAPIWGTFLHELHNAYTSYNSVSAYQIQPSLLLGFFDEVFYRPLMPANRTFSPSLNFLLLLGVLYFAATLRTQFANRTVIALAVASLVPLSFAFGLIPPSFIVRLPFLANVAHIDNTFSCALIVLWAVLAGVGFAAAARRLGTPEGRGDLAIAGLLLFALVFGWVAFRQAVHRPIYGPAFTVNTWGHPLAITPFIWGYLASLLIATVVLSIALHRAAVSQRLTPSRILILGLCAAVLCWRHGQQAASVGFESYVVQPTTRVNFHAKSEGVRFLQAAQADAPSRVYGIRGNFFAGWNDLYRLETIHGPDALMSPWYRELTNPMDGIERVWDWRLSLDPEHVPAARPYLDALNVRFYVDRRSDQGLMGRALKIAKLADLDIYESPTVWPRAFFSDRLFVYDRVEDLVKQFGTGDGRPFAAIQRKDFSEQSPLAALWGDWSTRTVNAATHYRLTENTTSFDVHANGPGVVVLEEAWWPGDFRASVNDKKVPVIRLNHAFKGIAITGSGDFHVSFQYVPKGWYRNVTLCLLGLALLVGSGFVVARTTRQVTA